jgi:hypothetical protein
VIFIVLVSVAPYVRQVHGLTTSANLSEWMIPTGQGIVVRALTAMLFGGLGTLMFGELFSSLFISSAIVSKKVCSRL